MDKLHRTNDEKIDDGWGGCRKIVKKLIFCFSSFDGNFLNSLSGSWNHRTKKKKNTNSESPDIFGNLECNRNRNRIYRQEKHLNADEFSTQLIRFWIMIYYWLEQHKSKIIFRNITIKFLICRSDSLLLERARRRPVYVDILVSAPKLFSRNP